MQRPMALDCDTLERLVPDTVRAGDGVNEETLQLHLARYEFAAAHLRPGRVLDIACGVGYGARLLADRSPVGTTVLGVDVAEDAVAYARQRYGDERVRFVAADAMQFSDDGCFDSIVSLETIEHLTDPDTFVARLVAQLRPDGVLIGSVPTTPSVDANPHHLHDFTERSFRAMVQRHGLTEVACFRQVQPFAPGPLLHGDAARMHNIRRSLPGYYLAHPRSLARRVLATVRYGFSNRYITIVWRAP